jgi:DNA-binding transcriptional LysR family regulator
MKEVDVSLLPALVALLEQESVSLAAAKRGVTQPAMSKTLQQLREALGDELLVKVGRGLVRSARASWLLPRAKQALADAQRVMAPSPVWNPHTATGPITIALSEEMLGVVAAPLFARMRQEAPGINLRLRALSQHTTDQGRRGEVDVAIAPMYEPALPDLSDFVVKPQYTRTFVTASQTRAHWTLQSFCAADHILVAPSGGDTGFIDEALQQRGKTRRVALIVPSFLAALHVLAHHKELVCTLPKDVVPVGSKLRVSMCPVKTPTFPMALVWHMRFTSDARNMFVRNLTARVLAQCVAR